MYIETALEETIKDGDMRAFKSALTNVLEAAKNRQESIFEPYVLREGVYRKLLEDQTLTLEAAIFTLETVGITPEADMPKALLVQGV